MNFFPRNTPKLKNTRLANAPDRTSTESVSPVIRFPAKKNTNSADTMRWISLDVMRRNIHRMIQFVKGG